MNAGLANLATLKRHLLPDTWLTETSMDTILADLGLGVASQMEEFCARKFARAEDAVLQLPADTMLIQLPRFPIEGTPTIELRSAGSQAWEEQEDSIDNVAENAGIIYLTAPIGTSRDRLRITWDGGFWWDLSEDADAPDEMPEGATAVPDGLRLAWLLQCHHILAARELLSVRALPSDKAAAGGGADAQIQLLPSVKDALGAYRILAA